MDVYILRHGKAEQRSSQITSDAKRKLTVSGIHDMEKIVRGMNALHISFDCIASSPLVRAKETAMIVVRSMWENNKSSPTSDTNNNYDYSSMSNSTKRRLEMWDDLRPESDPIDTHKRLSKLEPYASILLVGHEPHLSLLISSLTTNRKTRIGSDMMGVAVCLKKGGLAHIRTVPSHSSRIQGVLKSLMTPKQLKLCVGVP